jgi:hypothetical protein
VVARPEQDTRATTQPAKTVVPAAYTFENTSASEASIRQLQARFDELLQNREEADVSNGSSDQGNDAHASRIRLKPAQAP